MECTVLNLRFHDRGVELDLQPIEPGSRPFLAKGSIDLAIDAALALNAGDRVRIEGDEVSDSRPWAMLSRLERV
jgi:hypothetical protein